MIGKGNIWRSRHYTVLRLYLTIVGIWPYHKLRYRCVRFVPMFTFCFSILIPQLLYVLIGSINLDDVFECVPSIFISLVFSFKMASMMLNIEKVRICLNMIEEDWLSLNDVEKTILQRHSEYGRYLTTFYAVFMHTTTILFVLKPVILTLVTEDILNATTSSISGASKLPFRVEYGERLDQYLYPIAVHCYMAVVAHAFVTVAVDGLYYILIQHACGMFSVVGYELESIGENEVIDFDARPNKLKDDNYRKALDCLRRHLQVIKFAELIESLYTKIFLANININMVGGSLIGIQILMNLDKDVKDIAAPVTIYIAQLTHLFLHFWQAQFLSDYSALPYESICRANWYYTSKRCQKLLLLIMNRTVSPCRITAGKIVALSIENFATVLKTSFSYLTMFRSLQ